MHDKHTNIGSLQPGLYASLLELGSAAQAAALEEGISARLVELIRVRVSQLNGCAFCLRMHTRDAVAQGETADRLAVLPAWRESAYFDDVEKDALALAERVTQIHSLAAKEQLEPTGSLTASQVAAVAWVAIVINSFNRIAITSHYRVAPSS